MYYISRVHYLRKLFFAFLFLSAFGYSSFSDSSPEFVNITESTITKNINQQTITVIFRSDSGILWIGTQHGLYRYDGVTLTTYNSEEGGREWIPSSDIRAITQDSDGLLLVGTYGAGLLRWNSSLSLFENFPIDEELRSESITYILSSENGYLWIGSNSGISVFDQKLARDTSWLNSSALAQEIGKIEQIVELPSGDIIAATASALYRISISENRIRQILPTTFHAESIEKIASIEIDKVGNTLYVGKTNGDILSFNLSDMSLSARTTVQSDTAASVTRMLFNEEVLWIGTNSGLVQADPSLSKLQRYQRKNSQITGNHITSLAADQGLVWVGTYRGLNTLNFVQFETFTENNSNIFDDVLAFEEDLAGEIWVGTYNGLYHFDTQSRQHKLVSDPSGTKALSDQRIMTIAGNLNELWLGYRNAGVEIYDRDSGTTRFPPIEENAQLAVTKILHGAEGYTWIASYNLGLYRISDSSKEVTSYLKSGALSEATVTILFHSTLSGLIVGTEKSAYKYIPDTDSFLPLDIRSKGDGSSMLILSIGQSPNLDILIGTKEQGLFFWSEQSQRNGDLTVLPFAEPTDLDLSTVYGIEFDANGNIWCSTQRGLVKLNQSGSFLERYTATQGIQGDDFNFGASFTDSNGLMYFGGIRGYSRFDPLDMDVRAAPPEVAIADISYSNLTIRNLPPPPTPTTLELTHKDYFVKFNFSVLDFLDPEKNQYRYKLEGFDPNWVDNGTNNSATYTNLPPGDYVLRVQGANSAGVWNLEGASLPVRVLPPFWKTWWAYTFYTMIGLIIFWMSKRSYDSYAIEKRANERVNQMHEDAERADDEMQEQLEIQDDLINSVYRHNTSTLQLVSDCISVQANYTEGPEDPESTQSNIRRVEMLGVLESCVYYQSEQILADLHKFTDMVLETLLKNSSVGSESIVTINEVTRNLVPIDIASPLCILIGEILENCFTHAVDIDRKANYMHIEFSIQNKDSPEPSYSLSIQDNGLGIPDNINCSYPETAGLGIAAAIAIKLGGVLDISVDKGTTVALNFPLAKPV